MHCSTITAQRGCIHADLRLKQYTLTINTYPNLANNLPDLWFKTHVKHTISLIDNKVGGSAQVRHVFFEQINQSARRSNTDLSTCQASSSCCQHFYNKLQLLRIRYSLSTSHITLYFICRLVTARATDHQAFYMILHPV